MSRRGAPTKEQRYQKKLEKLETELKTAITDGNRMVVEHYVEYLQVLDDIALGKVRDVTPASRISAAKTLIEKVENIKEELELDNIEEGSPEAEEIIEEQTVVDVNDLIGGDIAEEWRDYKFEK